MPKIFEYLGILIFFYSNEHEPIHVHARKGNNESKAEFIIQDGKITKIRIKQASGISPLDKTEMKAFREFLEIYADKIVKKWIDYFILHKDVEFEKDYQKNKMKIIEEPHIEYAIKVGVISAKYISEYKIQLMFKDDSEQVVDFEEFLLKSQHSSIQKYLNLEKFKQFKIINGNLNWNNYDMIFPLSDLKKGTIS